MDRAGPTIAFEWWQKVNGTFVVGQKWIMADAIFGTFTGEVIEVSDDGALGYGDNQG
jgi:hypothetical protein